MFDWDDENGEHIARHGVTPEEVEEVLGDSDRVSVSAHRVRGERRRAIVGMTASGRLLYVVYTMRGGLTRPVTVHLPGPRDERRHVRERG